MSGDNCIDKNTEKYTGNYVETTKKYSDIIGLPHPVSTRHPQMPLLDRAAQFSPFAALAGHDEAIEETARLTEERREPDEGSQELLEEGLRNIKEHLKEHPYKKLTATFTYFVPDERKSGGSYKTVTGIVKKIREYEREIILSDGIRISFDNLVAIKL